MRHRRPGISVFAMIFPAVVFVGFVELLRHSHHTTTAVERGERVLEAAESEIDAYEPRLQADPLHAVRHSESFVVDPLAMEYVARAPGAARLRLRYSNHGKPILFADRKKPTERWDAIEVTAAFLDAGKERRAVASYRMEVARSCAGAVVCSSGDVMLAETTRTRVFGPTRARGATVLPEVRFDCDRFETAARAGGGLAFEDLASFAQACNQANAQRRPLEGIIVVHIDTERDGAHPTLRANTGTRPEHRIGQGVHVRGTLLFRFHGDARAGRRLTIDTPLNVNAADLTNWEPDDETTYPTGYPPTFADLSRAPWSHSISPKFVTFTPRDGLPAVIVDGGSLAIRHAANVCGVVFASAQVHVTNARGETQFLHGAIMARDGVALKNGAAGRIAVRFDRESLTGLQTQDDAAKSLTRTGFALFD